MDAFILFMKNIGRSILVVLGYIVGLMLAGFIGAILGEKLPARNDSSLGWLFIASILLGLFIIPTASHLALLRRQQFILWASMLLLAHAEK